jgi:hypothetical protein
MMKFINSASIDDSSSYKPFLIRYLFLRSFGFESEEYSIFLHWFPNDKNNRSVVSLTQFMPGPRKEGEVGSLQDRLDIFEIPEVYNLDHLIEAARRVSLTNVRGIYPYLNAQISLEEVSIDSLVPTARYVLRNNLYAQKQLHEQLLRFGIDSFHLTKDLAAARLYGNSGEQILVPPIIEVSEDDGGVNAITDGLHRITKARERGEESVSVLKIEGSATPLPVEPVNWDEVRIVDQVPPLSSKRWLRFTDAEEMFGWFGLTGERLGRILSGVRKNDPIGYTMLFRNLGMTDITRGDGRDKAEELRRRCGVSEVVVYDSNGNFAGIAAARRFDEETPEMTAAIAAWENFNIRTIPFRDFANPEVLEEAAQGDQLPEVTYRYKVQTSQV